MKVCFCITCGSGGIVLTKDQIRDGRALLRWSARKLGEEASVGLATIQRLEADDEAVDAAKFGTIKRIRKALEDGGIEFLPDGSVRRRSGIE
jgi:predicted transcriptional regulator